MSESASNSVPPATSELASSESLQKLDQRHEELLVKLDSLCQELEAALANLLPKEKSREMREAA